METILHKEETQIYTKMLINAVHFSYIKNNVFVTCADGQAYAIGSDN